jgi:hypothetical protein
MSFHRLDKSRSDLQLLPRANAARADENGHPAGSAYGRFYFHREVVSWNQVPLVKPNDETVCLEVFGKCASRVAVWTVVGNEEVGSGGVHGDGM